MFKLIGKKIIAIFALKMSLTGPMFISLDNSASCLNHSLSIFESTIYIEAGYDNLFIALELKMGWGTYCF